LIFLRYVLLKDFQMKDKLFESDFSPPQSIRAVMILIEHGVRTESCDGSLDILYGTTVRFNGDNVEGFRAFAICIGRHAGINLGAFIE
jgi:hypothetical protein